LIVCQQDYAQATQWEGGTWLQKKHLGVSGNADYVVLGLC